MIAGDLEQLAVQLYEAHHLDPERALSTATLARKELGDDAIVSAPLTVSGPAVLFMLGGRPRIGVRRGLPREYQLHFVGHELAHYLLEREGYREADIEQACDYLSAALGAPRPAVRRVYRFAGLDLPELARAWRSTQTGALLRIGEVDDMPVAAVAPRVVRVRGGGDEFVWPSERELRRLARDGGAPGLRKVPITDGRGRTALVGGQ